MVKDKPSCECCDCTQAAGKRMSYGYDNGPWNMTPRWHPWRWLFDLDIRRRTWENYQSSSWWEYGNSQKVARKLLRSEYGEKSSTEGMTGNFKRSGF